MHSHGSLQQLSFKGMYLLQYCNNEILQYFRQDSSHSGQRKFGILIKAGVEMKEIKIVIVDDSPFSVGLISNMLTGKGFHVAGSANCLKDAVEVVAELKPDLVTMD